MSNTTEEILRSALAAAGYNGRILLSPIPTGRSNHVFKVSPSGGPDFIARLSRHQDNRFEMEQAVMAVAQGAGIPVPDVMDLVPVPTGDQSVLLLSLVDGVTLEHAAAGISHDALDDLAGQVGRTLASIHSLAIGSGYGNLDPNLDGRSASLGEWFIDRFRLTIKEVREHLVSDREVTETLDIVENYILVRRSILSEIKPVLLHGDFRPGNILVADGRISGIIDWEAAKSGPPAFDFGWWDWMAGDSETPFPSTALHQGYLEHRQLDSATFDALRQLAIARITIGHLGWLIRTENPGGFKSAREKLVAMRKAFAA